MSFAGTADRSALAIQRETERDGTSLTADADRETVTYTAKFLADNLESALNNLSDAVTGQLFHPWEVADAKKAPEVVSEVTSVAIPASRNTSAMKLPSTSASLPFDERLRQELRAHLWAGACRLLIDK